MKNKKTLVKVSSHCPLCNGCGEFHTFVKVNLAPFEMKGMRDAGATIKEIAEKFKTTQSNVFEHLQKVNKFR